MFNTKFKNYTVYKYKWLKNIGNDFGGTIEKMFWEVINVKLKS